jgi:hypothetical protein
MIQSRKMWQGRQVSCIAEMRIAYKILIGKPEKRDHWED